MGYKIFITFFFFFFFLHVHTSRDGFRKLDEERPDGYFYFLGMAKCLYIYIYIYIKELGVGQGHHLLPPNSPLHTRKRERIIRTSDLCFIKHGS
jgi:hypothetical protein